MTINILFKLSVVICIVTNLSCRPFKMGNLESAEFYGKKLLDPNYKWDGPVSREDRIPVLHAARALAYLGDEGAEQLIGAIGDQRIEIFSIFDALGEIGIPVYLFSTEIIEKRESAGVKRWWKDNQDSSRKQRSKYRKQIGLPSL